MPNDTFRFGVIGLMLLLLAYHARHPEAAAIFAGVGAAMIVWAIIYWIVDTGVFEKEEGSL